MSSSTQPANEVGVRIAIAQVTLAVHRIRHDSGRCEACGRYGPCEEANNAANLIASYGLPVADSPAAPGSNDRMRRLRERARQGQNSPRSWGVAARLSG
jgi:hypothetical protein